MSDTQLLGFMAHDEAVRGNSIKIRSALEDKGWETNNLEAVYPGADFMWLTAHIVLMDLMQRRKTAGVQRKTTEDFLTSWWDGRVQRQLYDLIRSTDYPILLLEGAPRIDHKTGGIVTSYGAPIKRRLPSGNEAIISYNSYTHAIADLTGMAPGHFFLILSPDMQYTIEWSSRTGPEKFNSEEMSGWERQELPPRHNNWAMKFMLGMNGIGEELAKRILRHYGTPLDALRALIAGQWPKDIPGVGKGTANAVLEQLQAHYRPFGKK